MVFNDTSNNVSVILRQSVLLVEETTFCSSLNIKVRENRRGNKEWTIQRNWQHWAHKTQYENEQNTTQKTKKMSNTDPTKNTTQKTKKMSNTDPTKNQG